MQPSFNQIHVHGDNIVECERVLSLIRAAFRKQIVSVSLSASSAVCPCYLLQFRHSKNPLSVTFYPGFERWNHDILESVRDCGGVLREAADAIVTACLGDKELPLFAIEFCGALPAGNQAWQRSGRAYSFGSAKIPYLYISDLGGYELDGDRIPKSPRMPNAAVPFSYLAFSIEQQTPVLPVFQIAPGADEVAKDEYRSVFGDKELLKFIQARLLQKDDIGIIASLQNKALTYVKKRSDASIGRSTLSSSQWQTAFDRLQKSGGLSKFLLNDVRQNWSKTVSINTLTSRARQIMKLGSEHGVGLTSSRLPMCLLDISGRQSFANDVMQIFSDFPDRFQKFLLKKKPLAICWITGFKPSGDDSRPDRGLPPLTRMLIGGKHDMLTIVYGPAPEDTWKLMESDPMSLARNNGLWEAIMATSDALLIESSTDNITQKGYVRKDWSINQPFGNEIIPVVLPSPKNFNEHDVDTVLHILLSELMNPHTFESMCNPPGGDWSGISLLDQNQAMEHRWLSLPRVSGSDTKRPDHVIQIFGQDGHGDIILVIESKELSRNLEVDIGPKLTKYLRHLFSTPSSVERVAGTSDWVHSGEELHGEDHVFATAGAFIAGNPDRDMASIRSSSTDIVFLVRFCETGERSEVDLVACTRLGETVAEFLLKNILSTELISITLLANS